MPNRDLEHWNKLQTMGNAIAIHRLNAWWALPITKSLTNTHLEP
jgi:hypothetical protein